MGESRRRLPNRLRCFAENLDLSIRETVIPRFQEDSRPVDARSAIKHGQLLLRPEVNRTWRRRRNAGGLKRLTRPWSFISGAAMMSCVC